MTEGCCKNVKMAQLLNERTFNGKCENVRMANCSMIEVSKLKINSSMELLSH